VFSTVTTFWDSTPCSLVSTFGENCPLYSQASTLKMEAPNYSETFTYVPQ